MEHPQNSVTGIDPRETRQPYTWRDILGPAPKHKTRRVGANPLGSQGPAARGPGAPAVAVRGEAR